MISYLYWFRHLGELESWSNLPFLLGLTRNFPDMQVPNKRNETSLSALHSPHHGPAHGPMHAEGICNSGWAISPPGVGQTGGLKRHMESPSAEENAHIYGISTWSENVAIFVYIGRGGRAEKDVMTLKEMNRLKNNRSGGSSIYALFMVHCLSPWPMAMAMPEYHSTHA